MFITMIACNAIILTESVHVLAQCLPMVCRDHKTFQITTMTLESKVNVKYLQEIFEI